MQDDNVQLGQYKPFDGSEDRFSAEFWSWIWNYCPQTRRTIFHVENEKEKLQGESEKSYLRRMSKAKAKGVVPGVWDYFWFWKGKVYVIELKVGRGTLSDDQKKVRDAILVQFPDAIFMTFWSLEAVKEWVRGLL